MAQTAGETKPRQPPRRVREPPRKVSSRTTKAKVVSEAGSEEEEDSGEALDLDLPRVQDNKSMKSIPRYSVQHYTGGEDVDLNAPPIQDKDGGKGLDRSLPPIHDIDEIFGDMTKKAIDNLGFKKVLEHLGSHNLRVATMCSGTEAPISAIISVRESLLKDFNKELRMDHLFSAEIVPFKQAYIERNFQPELLFRDVTELSREKATTAYGSVKEVPGEVDLLIVGTSCVDFSNLNSLRIALHGGGESGDTFFAVINYCRKRRPKLVILENVSSAPWSSLQKVCEEINYAAKSIKVDTKYYYIPQTRQRGYLLAIDRSQFPGSEEVVNTLVKKMLSDWESNMEEFKRHASSPFDDFIYDNGSAEVQEMKRDFLASRGKAREAINWELCKRRHSNYRVVKELGTGSYYTKSKNDGSIHMPDHVWADYAKLAPERLWDTWDMAHLRGFTRGYDFDHKTRVLELSQNIDRDEDNRQQGIANCVTPTGIPWVTTQGRILCGYETLILQGQPLKRLNFARETQKQRQDLAGNAMTTTVVGSAILSALISCYKSLPNGAPVSNTDKRLIGDCGYSPKDDHQLQEYPFDLSQQSSVLVSTVLEEANKSFRLCLCEGRILIKKGVFFRCKTCGHTACQECHGNPKHSYEKIGEYLNNRTDPSNFKRFIQNALPMRLEIAGLSITTFGDLRTACDVDVDKRIWETYRKAIASALGEELQYNHVKRTRNWTVTYEGAHSRLELSINSDGLEWLLYVKVEKTESGNSEVRKLLSSPIARMSPKGKSLLDGEWQLCFPVTNSFTIKITPTGPQVQSFEMKIGLREESKIDSKSWSQLSVSAPDETMQKLNLNITGIYELHMKCGAAMGTLHKKITKDGERPIFFFLHEGQNTESKDDHFVFASQYHRLEHQEERRTIAAIYPGWELPIYRPNDKSQNGWGNHTPKCSVYGEWKSCEGISLQPFRPEHEAQCLVQSGTSENTILTRGEHGCSDAYFRILSFSVPLSADTDAGLVWKTGPWVSMDIAKSPALLEKFSWLLVRAPKLEQFSKWLPVSPGALIPQCTTCAPKPAPLLWKEDAAGKKIKPYEDITGAGEFERRFRARPSPFYAHTRIDEEHRGQLHVSVNMLTLIHRAFAKLQNEIHDPSISAQWRLVTDKLESLPHDYAKAFEVNGNKENPECAQPPGFVMELRSEQLRSLGWMIEQEDPKNEPFVEEEVEESLLPAMGWRAEARATVERRVFGGVLADEVGFGKTVTTLGLIDAQFPNNLHKIPEDMDGFIPIKATLIVAPPTLVTQWEKEIAKFLGTRYNVLVIPEMPQLKALSVKDFRNADIIVLSWKLLVSKTYIELIQQFTVTPEPAEKSGRACDVWFEHARGRIPEHVNYLRENGRAEMGKFMVEKRKRLESDEIYKRVVPTVRLRGKAFRANKAAQACIETDEAGNILPRKRALEQTESEDEVEENASDQEVSIQGMRKSKAKGKDFFGFGPADRNSKWESTKKLPLQVFKFNRVVIDEYTYLTPELLTAVRTLISNCRWILSGTPPLSDFAAVKSIALLLGINLGIDDDAYANTQSARLKAIQRDRTAVEKFRDLQESRSLAWHERRHEVAQDFLAKFVRQNFADIDEIPSSDHWLPVNLPAAELALYLELFQQVVSQDMSLRKVKDPSQSGLDSQRAARFREIIGASGTREEALLRCCSYFEAVDQEQSASNVCDRVVAIRQGDCAKVLAEFRSKLENAVWLQAQCNDKRFFTNFVSAIQANSFRDRKTATELGDLIKEGLENFDQAHGFRIYKTTVVERPAKRVKTGEAEKETAFVKELCYVVTNLQSLSHDFVNRRRALKFFEAVRSLQSWQSPLKIGAGTNHAPECSRCHKTPQDPENVFVLAVCGHIMCNSCSNLVAKKEACLAKDCTAGLREIDLIKASHLSQEDGSPSNSLGSGAKLTELIKLLTDERRVKKDDQVLLFIQFESLIDKVSRVLHENDITHGVLSSTNHKKIEQTLEDFKEGANKMKVLILCVAKETAAGLNLYHANHVIFLSPVVSKSQTDYEASMTQAIGRSRRYGQGKHVHIYHFFALRTIEVNILQERFDKILVKRGREFRFVERENLLDGEKPDWQGASLSGHRYFDDTGPAESREVDEEE